MKNFRQMLVGLSCLLMLAGCSKKSTPVDTGGGVPDQTDGRLTIIGDETTINTRLIVGDDSLAVDSLTGFGKRASVETFSLKQIAQIASPTVNKQKLQATAVSLQNSVAYISYNMQGSEYLGAIDVVQLQGNGKKTQILTEMTFTDTDVSSVFFDGKTAYMAEATSNPSYATPAIIEMISSTNGKFGLAGNLRSQVASYVATSVVVGNGSVYATSGNTGGLYQLSRDSLKILSYTPLSDARWVDLDAKYMAVVQGGGQLSVFDATTGKPLNAYTFPGTTIPESKSTVQVIGGKALIAAGDGGVQLMNLATGKIVGSVPHIIVRGLDSSLSVTNAVSGSGKYVFISNGEAGVYVAQASQNLGDQTGDSAIKLTVLGKLRFQNLQSVNHVAFDGSTLVVASGLGGVKIVSVHF